MDVTYRCSAEDYVEAQCSHAKRSGTYWLLLVMGTLALLIGAFDLWRQTLAAAFPPLLLAFLWLGWAFVFLPWWQNATSGNTRT